MSVVHHRTRGLAVGAGAFVLVAFAAGGAFAASNPPTLYACYDVQGNVRMSDIAQCKLPGGGRLVSWGTQPVPGLTGPQGATGATGPTGPTGAEGAVGPSGARAWALVGGDASILSSNAGIVSVEHFATGIYCVYLAFPSANTAAVASAGRIVPAPWVAVTSPGGCLTGADVAVSTFDPTGALADSGFSVVVP